MLPIITIPEIDLVQLLETRSLGDVVDYAERFSLALLKKAYETKHPDLLSEKFLKNIESYSLVGISEEEEHLFLHLASDRQQFHRAILRTILFHPENHLALSEIDKTLIDSFFVIASLTDELYFAWRKRVVHSELGKAFASGEKKDDASHIRQKFHLSQASAVSTVLKKEGDAIKEETVLQAFPEVVNRIIVELEKTSEKLLTLNAPVELLNYINALADFYHNDLPQNDSFLLKALDGIWLKLFPKIVPVHGMEVYEDPGSFIIAPELTMHVLDERYSHINEGIANTKQNLIEFLTITYPANARVYASLPVILKAEAGVYTKVMVAGRRIHSRTYGQNIPNWEDIRLQEGVRIFIDMYTASLRWENEHYYLQKILAEEQFKGLYKTLFETGDLYYYTTVVLVAGHELSHNLCLSSDTKERISHAIYEALEECKASFCILASLQTVYTHDEIHKLLLSQFASDLYFLSYRNIAAKQSYYLTAVLSVTAFAEAGILTFTDDSFSFHLTKENVTLYLNSIKTLTDEIVAVYSADDAKKGKTFLSEHFKENAIIHHLLNRY